MGTPLRGLEKLQNHLASPPIGGRRGERWLKDFGEGERRELRGSWRLYRHRRKTTQVPRGDTTRWEEWVKNPKGGGGLHGLKIGKLVLVHAHRQEKGEP